MLKNSIAIAKLKPAKHLNTQLKRTGKIFNNLMEARNLALEKRRILAMKKVGILKSNNNAEEIILPTSDSRLKLPEL